VVVPVTTTPAAGAGARPDADADRLDEPDGEPDELTAPFPATGDEAWAIVVPAPVVRPVDQALARVRRRLGALKPR
jgi:hypothetical protein